MSAFGIGTNEKRTDGGAVRGRQIMIACKTWFTSTGTLLPLSFKYEGDDGMLQHVVISEIVSSEDKNYSGIPSKEYCCRAMIGGLLHEFRLIFYVEACRWVMVLPGDRAWEQTA